jgi:hypothetical protein
MESGSKKEKKAGRPVKAIKREIRICIHCTHAEYFIIKQKATEFCAGVNDYIREASINAKTIARLTREEMHFVRQLIAMSNNLNEMIKICSREGLFEAMKYFENYRNQIDNLLEKFKI